MQYESFAWHGMANGELLSSLWSQINDNAKFIAIKLEMSDAIHCGKKNKLVVIVDDDVDYVTSHEFQAF